MTAISLICAVIGLDSLQFGQGSQGWASEVQGEVKVFDSDGFDQSFAVDFFWDVFCFFVSKLSLFVLCTLPCPVRS